MGPHVKYMLTDGQKKIPYTYNYLSHR
jgi:hypothetical protein